MDPVTIGGLFSIGSKIIDKLFPDPAAKAEAQAKFMVALQEGELKELQARMSAIVAEAQSADPWTSRARPSFMYVMYVMILFGIPMGILSVFEPAVAVQIAAGMKAWLESIPGELYALFGVGYSGYSIARSLDKGNVAKLVEKSGRM